MSASLKRSANAFYELPNVPYKFMSQEQFVSNDSKQLSEVYILTSVTVLFKQQLQVVIDCENILKHFQREELSTRLCFKRLVDFK